MKPPEVVPSSAEVVRPVRDESGLPPMPSEDQPFFDQSLRASVRSLGRLIQKRRKVQP